jgi:hypothetical protein
MLVERREVNENYVINIEEIRDALLRISVLVTIRGGDSLLLDFM